MTAEPNFDEIPAYIPKKSEEFMSAGQVKHFIYKLNVWREQLVFEAETTINHIQEDSAPVADINDRATIEEEFALELRTRDRQRKLISKIDAALNRIENGTYGYCEVTGDPINIARLDARPVTTLSIEAQEMHERSEKLHSDD